MARIQLGNFGNVLPEVSRTPTQIVSSGQIIANAAGNAAIHVATQAQERNNREKKLIDQQKKGEDDILYTNIYSKAGVDLQVLDDDVNMQIKQGAKLDDVQLYREEGVQNIMQKYQYDVPERYRDRFAGALDAKAYESAAKVLPQFRASQQQSERVTLNETMQNALKSDTREEYKAVMQIGIEGSSLSAAEKQELINKSDNTWDVDKSGRLLEGLFRSQDVDAIQTEFQSDKLKEQFPYLQQDQITALQKSAYAKIDQINKAKETEAKAIDNDAKDAVSEMKQIVASGGIPSVEVLTGLAQRTMGTSYAAEMNQYVAVADGVNSFLRMPPDQRGTVLSRMQSDQKTKPSDDPTLDKWTLDLYTRAHNESLSREKNDVAGNYNVVTGKELTNPPATSIALGEPQAINALRQNIKEIKAFNATRGITGNANPLTQQTQNELRQFWGKAPAEQRLQMLGNLKSASTGEPNAFSPMVQSIAGGANSYRLAAAIGNNPRYKETVALPIVKGQMRLEKKEVNFDTKQTNSAVNDYFTGLGLSDSGVSVYRDTAMAYYAESLHQTQAKRDANGKYAFDEDLFNDALIAVTGGRYIQGSNKVLRPYGVSDKSFRDQIKAFNDSNARNYGSDRSYFTDAKIMQNPKNPNQYYFMDGSRPIRTPNNQEILFMTIH